MKVNAKQMRILMCEKVMSRKDLAKASGVNTATISNVMHGESATTKTIGKLAKALGVDPTEIIDMDTI